MLYYICTLLLFILLTLFLFHPPDGTQKEAVPGFEPQKNRSGARQPRTTANCTNCTIVCRRRKELRVSRERLACLFEHLLLLSNLIVHDSAILLLAIPQA